MINVFTDGGARGNPGPAAIGVYIHDGKGNILYAYGKTIGVATNNVAEYSAVIYALAWLSEQKALISRHESISFFVDSLLICSQIKGLYKIKNAHLRELLFRIRVLEPTIAIPIYYFQIPREKNTKADALVNKALDNQI